MGKKIGKYELGKTLGTGNFSKVKLGTDTETGKNWAIKIIEKDQMVREHLEQQLKREIALMKMLRHENIVQLREVMQTTSYVYLVLELVTGGELFDRLVQVKRFTEPVSRRYFQQLVCAVQYCHTQGVVHRDLKPENLLLDGNDVLKVSDFGLANLQAARGDLLQTVCGTPNYVAPEVLKERGYSGLSADVWSCGVVLFVMLAGHLPFDDPNVNALFNKIERGEYRMARCFSESARDLIGKMLIVDPVKRVTLEDVARHPWFADGFNPERLISATPGASKDLKKEPSDKAIDDAINKVGGGDDVPASPAVQSLQGRDDAAKGQDSMELICRLTTGLLNPVVAAEPGITRVSPRVLSTASPKEIVDVLTALKCNPKLTGNIIKGFFNGKRGLLTYVVNIVPLSLPAFSLLEFRRARGDAFEFISLCHQVVAGMKHHARSEITLIGSEA